MAYLMTVLTFQCT